MQIDRSIQLVFPPAPQASGREALPGLGGGAPRGIPLNAGDADAAAPQAQSRVRPPRADGSSAAVPNTPAPAAPAGTTLTLSEQARQLSLAEQLEQGKHQGLFTHLTYSRAGALAPAGTQPPLGGSDAFARSAAGVMREFSEGLAALQGPPSPAPSAGAEPSAAAQDLASRLRQGWQQVTARLSTRA